MHWYDEYDHIGYDRSGGKVMKRADGTGNGIDAALNARDDPNYARTVYDAYNDREVNCQGRSYIEEDYKCIGTVVFCCVLVKMESCSALAPGGCYLASF